MTFGSIHCENGPKTRQIDNLIIEEIEFVADNFMTGKSVEQTRKGYRVTKIKSHLIFYKKAEDGIVEIIRILHQRMDIKKKLS